MFVHRLAYRHANGEVEGFTGAGFTKQGARQSALNKVMRKCLSLGTPMIVGSLIESPDGLTKEELRAIREDWMTEAPTALS